MKKRKTYYLDERFLDMLKALQYKMHYTSETAVIIEAVNTLNRKINPNYAGARAPLSAEERAARNIDVAALTKKRAEDAFVTIANALEGKIEVTPGGNKVVRYYTYNRNTRYEQKLPLESMTEDLLNSQYFPSKEDVKARQADGRADY